MDFSFLSKTHRKWKFSAWLMSPIDVMLTHLCGQASRDTIWTPTMMLCKMVTSVTPAADAPVQTVTS